MLQGMPCVPSSRATANPMPDVGVGVNGSRAPTASEVQATSTLRTVTPNNSNNNQPVRVAVTTFVPDTRGSANQTRTPHNSTISTSTTTQQRRPSRPSHPPHSPPECIFSASSFAPCRARHTGGAKRKVLFGRSPRLPVIGL